MIDIGIRLEPDGIKRLADKLLKLRVGLEVQAKTALKRVGEQYYEIVVSRMGEYRGGEMVFVDTYWKELSPIWLEEKRKQGLVEEIWEATGEIKSNVRVFDAVRTADGWSVFVGLKGVSPDVMAKAVRNEFGATFGDSTVPARPLFEPAKREMVYNPTEKARIIEAFRGAAKAAISGIR
jgi:hypothetical protein